MAAVTRFDDMSPELILCVFDYLSPADRYQSFFDCNSRLRLLIKNQTEYSRKNLDKDILRFSTLHSWYKHLSFVDDGYVYFIVPTRGQQPRYTFDTRVTDAHGLHWWFVSQGSVKMILNEDVRTIITRYPFRLNPFFYHLEYSSSDKSLDNRMFDGGHIILMRGGSSFETWLKNNYPEQADSILNSLHSSDIYGEKREIVAIFDGEWLKVTTAIRKAAIQIWNELKNLYDINPLQLICEE